MEPHNLQAASTYINNLLLARGLLKNGKPIDFARPEEGPGGTDGTMARIINLVNDLVVRRDVRLSPRLQLRWGLTGLPARSGTPRESCYDN